MLIVFLHIDNDPYTLISLSQKEGTRLCLNESHTTFLLLGMTRLRSSQSVGKTGATALTR
jgi:hypothetical protein